MAKKTEILSYEKIETLKETFKEIGGDQEKLANTLIDEVIFCGRTLSKLKSKVDEQGVVTEMCQGNYSIERENPALKSYNTTLKSYQNLIKQIKELLPSSIKITDDDGFDNF